MSDQRYVVLAIDDDVDFLELLRFRFEKEQCDYVTAVDGEEGLAKAREVKPNLILCDIKMPNMDGYAFVRELKQDEVARHIPIIILTSFEPMRDLFGIEGIQDYIVKSSDMSTLWKTVSKYLPPRA